MCGIFGFTGARDPLLAGRMAELLGHRGPDDRGWAETPGATLGAARLAIVGVGNGRQPLRSEDGGVVLVANGEIYNHAALREGLERRGHRFATDTDIEVIVHLYEESGVEAIGRLEGMFAFALWDGSRERLLLARDHCGMKPLLYAEHEGRLLFASEAKAILAPTGMPRAVDAGALDALLSFWLVPGDRTLFAGVRRLPPGHWMCVEGDPPRRTLRRWLPQPVPAPPPGDPPAAFRRLLAAAVESHLAAAVPQAFALSGGLDSSTVVALARRILGRPVRTFAVGVRGAGDERPFARAVAEHCGTDHLEIECEPHELLDRLPRVLWHLEEPSNGPLAANHLMFERIAPEARVVLVGEGADEILGGYARLKTAAGPLAWLPPPLARRAYLGRGQLLGGRRALYRDRFLAALPDPGLGEAELRGVFAAWGSRRREALLAFEQGVMLPASHLARLDRLAMAHSVETRLPFLDRAVAEFARRAPDRWKIRMRGEKLLLREAARGLLPEAVRLRPKYGMRDPAHLWLSSGLVELAREYLGAATLERRGYFRERCVRGILGRIAGPRRRPFDHWHLNLLLAIEAWHRLFIDPPRLDPPAAPPAPVAA